MNFEAKLKEQQYDELWQEYCGFLELSIQEYMEIQNRLMLEQMQLWCGSGLGKKLLGGRIPKTVSEFRSTLRLTDYADYADVLLAKDAAALPAEPIIWIQTTWEGGRHPVKLAPYTRGMLDVCKNNLMSIMILATSSRKGKFSAQARDRALFGLAPLPYVTGLFPLLIDEEIAMKFLPPPQEAGKMSFSERNRRGFSLGMKRGIDLFFGLSSVISYITDNFASVVRKGSAVKLRSLFQYSPRMLVRYLRASYRSKRDGTPLRPKDLFSLKAFVCAGTDTRSYKQSLADAWGVTPMEISAGTEPTIIGTETWKKDGQVFFPDAGFYEFIEEEDMKRNLDDPSFVPKTYLMDELLEGHCYELVVTSFKGGAFARYRVGDVYRCVSVGSPEVGPRLPKLCFVDRVPNVIDIAGFTRITENSIDEIIEMSGLGIENWTACKEYNDARRPYMHLYVELKNEGVQAQSLSRQVLVEHLSVYFCYFDSDYHDLKKMLGIEPLVVTILRTGSFADFEDRTGRPIRRINPCPHDVAELLRRQREDYAAQRGGRFGK